MLGNTDNIQDAFIYCPNMGTIQMDKILEQGIFISKREMSEMVEPMNSICNLIEMFKIRRNINMLNMHPDMAKEYFNQSGGNQLQDIESSKVFVNSNVLGLGKYSKNSQSSNVTMIIRKR